MDKNSHPARRWSKCKVRGSEPYPATAVAKEIENHLELLRVSPTNSGGGFPVTLILIMLYLQFSLCLIRHRYVMLLTFILGFLSVERGRCGVLGTINSGHMAKRVRVHVCTSASY